MAGNPDLVGYPGAGPGFARQQTDQYESRVIVAHFPVNQAILTPQHEMALRPLARSLARYHFSFVTQVEGRASQTGPEARNQELSVLRASAVRDYLVRYGMRKDQIGPIVGLGSKAPLEDSPGSEIAVNRSALIYYQLPRRVVVPVRPKPVPSDSGAKVWEIRALTSAGVHVSLGGAYLRGQLRKVDAKEERVYDGDFYGGGIGIGLKWKPGGASTTPEEWSTWTRFETDQRYKASDFDGTLARLTSANIRFFVGYSKIYISFPTMDANSISLGGWNLGTVALDASTDVGIWNMAGMS